ncbi:DUF397 domain-containing protein [Streptomyces albogriseolus]
MLTPDRWRKSSYSGSGDGNACVEVVAGHAWTAIRDSKAPAHGTPSLSASAFAAFVDALKKQNELSKEL